MRHLALQWICLGLLATWGAFAQEARLTHTPVIDVESLGDKLKTTGIEGYIHGAVPEYQQYVFQVPDPKKRFVTWEFPLLPKNKAIRDTLATLHRHDRVFVKGEYAKNPSPQMHIIVSEITVREAYDPKLGGEVAPRAREAKLPADLQGQTELVAMVHAVVANGAVVVLDYKDAVIPLVVKDPKLTADLYRGDKVHIRYKLAGNPERPSHVQLDTTAANPVDVREHFTDLNGKHDTFDGVLVRFPKSPGLKDDVYGVQVTVPDGTPRTYFLINFTSVDTYKTIRTACEKAWNAHRAKQVDARNRYVNPTLKVKVTGTVSATSPNQGQPNIVIERADDLIINAD